MLENYLFAQAPSWEAYSLAFALTVGAELVILWPLMRPFSRKNVLAVLLANLITHPVAVFLWIPFAADLDWTIRDIIMSAELVIPFIEACIYRGFRLGGFRKLLVYSFAANFASWTLVALLQI